MQINITRKNAGVSDSLRAYIEDKLGGLENHHRKLIDSQVLIDVVGRDNFVEVTLHVPGRTLFAKDESTNLRAAIDSCADKLDRQLKKKEEKQRRKSLTQEEAILSGKVIVEEGGDDVTAETEETPEQEIGQPILTFEQEDIPQDYPEERTGT
jgi:putative sigma-54 modulation protein